MEPGWKTFPEDYALRTLLTEQPNPTDPPSTDDEPADPHDDVTHGVDVAIGIKSA